MAREKEEMRSDYALYAVAIIFFILTGIVSIHQIGYRELWIVTTAVLGIFFIGLGYTQRPKAATKTTTIEGPSPAPTSTQTVQEEIPKETAQIGRELTEVKGIGAKRAEQLKALNIVSVEDLAKASAEELASKLKVSPKITERWIENAKELVEKS
ncbi:MAG: helix-hairpin-helix domain-containing protein [Candidatus Bathycorpusculaceae bacterium]